MLARLIQCGLHYVSVGEILPLVIKSMAFKMLAGAVIEMQLRSLIIFLGAPGRSEDMSRSQEPVG